MRRSLYLQKLSRLQQLQLQQLDHQACHRCQQGQGVLPCQAFLLGVAPHPPCLASQLGQHQPHRALVLLQLRLSLLGPGASRVSPQGLG